MRKKLLSDENILVIFQAVVLSKILQHALQALGAYISQTHRDRIYIDATFKKAIVNGI